MPDANSLWARENDRNARNSKLYTDIIREAYLGVNVAVAGHHLMFTFHGRAEPEEIPSADWLIFDHGIARKLWGDIYIDVLSRLAIEPVEKRDELLAKLYYGRRK